MTQNNKVGTVATSVFNDYGVMKCVYHHTVVVEWDNKHITLRTGGWKTLTTKTRMNQVSNQYGLGYQVYQEKFNWYVKFKDQIISFDDNTLDLVR